MADSLSKNIKYTTHFYSLQRYRNSSFKTAELSFPFELYEDFDG